jgi:acyl-CoA thioester hydrolase
MPESVRAEFIWPVRVYWEDTDAGGVVYYANYLKFMERARTEWLRSLGIEQIPLKEQHGLILVITHIEADYKRSARYGDLLQVASRMTSIGKASMSFEQTIYRHEVGGELLLEGKAKAACVDVVSFKPRPLPKTIVEKLPV